MRFLFRWAFRLFLVLVVLVVALLLLKDVLLKAFLESRIQLETGLETRISHFELGLLNPTVTLRDCTLYNSAEFGGSPMLRIPELHLEYDRSAAALSQVHLKLLRLNLAELNIIENQQGQTNVFGVLGGLGSVIFNDPRTSKTNSFPPGFKGIDTLNLTLGNINFINLKDPRRNRQLALGVTNEIIQNVRSPQDLNPLLLKLLFRTGISVFSNHWEPAIPLAPSAPRSTPIPARK
jgi:hypothetical protein